MKSLHSCTFCHTAIHPDDGIAWQGENPYHKWHTPDKTNKLEPKQEQVLQKRDQSFHRSLREQPVLHYTNSGPVKVN